MVSLRNALRLKSKACVISVDGDSGGINNFSRVINVS